MIHASNPDNQTYAFRWEEALARTPKIYITQSLNLKPLDSYRATLSAVNGTIIALVADAARPIRHRAHRQRHQNRHCASRRNHHAAQDA